MSSMTYQNVDRHLIEALPALLVPHARCIAQDFDGEHPGQYNVFEPIFRDCLDILLALPASPARDDLLRRGFAFVELMLHSPDPQVPNLAKIAVFEGQSVWWFARAVAFIGPAARDFLDVFEKRWCEAAGTLAEPAPDLDVIDLFGVREALFRVLGSEVAGLPAIPGVGAPYRWRELASLDVARRVPHGVVFLSCFGTSIPLLLAPIAAVACGPVALLQLARDLAAHVPAEQDASEQAKSTCFAIPIGERVRCMQRDDRKPGRYDGTLWIAPQVMSHGLGEPIKLVLAGQLARIHSRPAKSN